MPCCFECDQLIKGNLFMWREQLKSIKKELDMDTTTEKSSKTVVNHSSALHQPNDKGTKKRKHKNHKGKASNIKKSKDKKINYNPYPLIGNPAPLSSKVAVENTYTHELKVSLDKLDKPNRDVCSMFLEGDVEEDLNKAFSEISIDNSDSSSQDLVIGLDFGTAFTKVVIGEVTYAHAISFGEHGNLLPSKVYVNSQGKCFLSAKHGEHILTDLKLPLLLENSSEVDHVAIVSFLALVFLECRSWSTQSIYKDFTIDWLVNVGLPTESYHDESLSKLYRQLISAAWVLSYCNDVTIKLAERVMKELPLDNGTIPAECILSNDVINLFPEFAAQIVGYVQSPSRREYSHLLIDVGAGTLDVAMFIVTNDDGEWLFQTTGKDIKALGADILAKHRVLNGKISTELGRINSYPNDKEIAKAIGVTLSELLKIDKPFSKAVNVSLKKVISSVAGGYKFHDLITTFICGGGSHVELYRKEVDVVNNGYPLKILSLPVPERLRSEGITLSTYHRLSVAYGLSYDPFDIGVVIRKKVDIKPQQRTEYEPSNYLLCPK